MIVVECLRDLEQFGIVALTGEADALNYRILCDLTEQGCEIVAEAYGLKPDAFLESWNPSSTAGKHVGCVMLSQWQQIAILALVRSCQHALVVEGGACYGIGDVGETDEEFLPARFGINPETDEIEVVEPHRIRRDGQEYEWLDTARGRIVRAIPGRARHLSCRNVHQMSGRLD